MLTNTASDQDSRAIQVRTRTPSVRIHPAALIAGVAGEGDASTPRNSRHSPFGRSRYTWHLLRLEAAHQRSTGQPVRAVHSALRSDYSDRPADR